MLYLRGQIGGFEARGSLGGLLNFDLSDIHPASYVLGIVTGVLLSRLSRGRPIRPTEARPLTPVADAEIRELVRRGATIEAMKQYRMETGSTLREAKEFVDGLG